VNSSDSLQHENSSVITNIHEDEEILSISVVSMDISILDSVYIVYKDDKFFDPVIAYPERYPTYTLYDDLIFYQDRLYIPANDRTIREILLVIYHDDRNHFGDRKTRVVIITDYFWPDIINDIDIYIRSYDSYIRKKSMI
jgi:hypothetical protein